MSAESDTSTRAPDAQVSWGGPREGEATSATPGPADAAALDAEVVVRRGDFVLDARLRVEPGEIVAMLGPNGSGKSTFLQAIAGLLPLETGTVMAAGRVLSHRDVGRESTGAGPGRSRPSVQVAPEHREIGLLGQDPLLFPHLSAVENVAFGRRAQGVPKASARREALDWIQAVQLPGYSERRPAQLSGGQQQRVALARALAARPSLLLLDEPMAALDVQSAPQIRLLLREQLSRSGTAALLVTHDVLDAIVLADRIVILDEGRIVDQGPTTEVLAQPRNRFVADLVGVNLVAGVVDSDPTAEAAPRDGEQSIRLPDGRVLVGQVAGGPTMANRGAGAAAETREPERAGAGEPAHAVFRPAAVTVELTDPAGESQRSVHDATAAGSGRGPVAFNRWVATVVALEPVSGGIRIRTDDPAGIMAELPAVEVAALAIEPGCLVHLSLDAAHVAIHPVVH